MADESAPTIISTPGAPEPGPASGTTPAVGSESAAPAAFSADATIESTVTPDASPAAAVETPTDAKPTSLLSELTGEKPAEPAAETKPDAPDSVKADAPAEPAAPPTYESFTLPEGVTLQDEKIGAFTGILGEFEQRIAADPTQAHAAAQEMGQKLINLYVAEAQAHAQQVAKANTDAWNAMRENWLQEYRDDPAIGRNRQETSRLRMGALLDSYSSSEGADRRAKLGEALAITGAGDNPEVLRFVHWAATRLTETARPIPATLPRSPVVTTRAQRMYRNSASGAA